MFRYISVILLLIAFTGQAFQQSFLVLSYYTNTGAYSKNCVNKARPMLHCNGKCQLAKKIKQQEEKDQKNPERRPELKSEVSSSRTYFASLPLQDIEIHITHHSFYIAARLPGHIPGIFHPPSLG
jgi:hypothetical protein